MVPTSRRRAAGAAVVFILGADPSAAQTPTGAITGILRDSAGATLSAVDLTARSRASGYEYVTLTSGSGRYWLRALPPGEYDITAERIGLEPASRLGVRLGVGQTLTIDLTLGIEAVVLEEIQVMAGAPLIETTESRVAFRLDQAQIARLPEESRSFQDLALLLPGSTQASNVFVFGRFGPATNIGALGSASAGILVDGGDFKEPLLNEPSGGLPLLAVQEFEVLQTSYAAEFGRASSGIINTVTRRGSNEFRLEGFSLFRDEALNALGHFETEKPDFSRSHWGLAAGGPISRDRTHYFLAYERKVENHFSTIETGGLFPEAEGTFATPFTDNLLFARLDHRIDDRHELGLRYSGEVGERVSSLGECFAQCSFASGNTASLDVHSALLSHRWAIGSSLLNQARLHVIGRDYRNLPNSPGGPQLCYPTICLGGSSTSDIFKSTRIELADELSVTASGATGTHRLKLGTQLSWYHNQVPKSRLREEGLFLFDSDTATDPLIGQLPLGGWQIDAKNVQVGLFIQDDWNPIPNLTLNLGLRYDLETNGSHQDFVSPFAGEIVEVPTEPRRVDSNNLGPRLGFAWDPSGTGRTVVRGGFGIFYDGLLQWPIAVLERSSGFRTLEFENPGTKDFADLDTDPDAALPIVWFTGAELDTPLTRKFSLGFEQLLPGDVALRLDGLMVQARNQIIARNFNTNDPSTGQSRYPDFNIVLGTFSVGEAEAKLLLATVRKAWRQGWASLSYTLADRKNTNDAWNRDAALPFDPDSPDIDALMAPAAWDERHRLVATAGWQLPLGASVTLKSVYASARPYSGFTADDQDNDPFNLDLAPGEKRNGRRGPDFFRTDLGLAWDFTVWGTGRLGVQLNVYNLFDRTNFDPESVADFVESPLFGQPLGALAGRQVELGVRVRW